MRAGYVYGDGLRQRIASRLDNFDPRTGHADGLKHAAVAITLVEEDGAAAFILTRRASRMRSHQGQFALPGGRLEEGEGPVAAALRELDEEVGLCLEEDAVLGRLDDYRTRSGYLISPVVVWAGGRPDLTPDPEEVAKIYRIPLNELDRPGSPEFVHIPESNRPVIRLLLGDDKLHAPSAALVYQFREVCMHGRPTRVAHYEQPVWAWR
jgi:8-oxo-dGTP pyrophosphatase MutT (NUDIX family)